MNAKRVNEQATQRGRLRARGWLGVLGVSVGALIAACAGSAPRSAPAASSSTSATPAGSQAPPNVSAETVITIVGTNDLHGRIRSLPLLAGYVDRLRSLRAHDGGVLLVDAGDMFQGTLESNTNEGAAVVEAYGALGYAAVAVGNHEFDFGPVGPSAVPVAVGDDPRGALKRAAANARFPFLIANARLRARGSAWTAPGIVADTRVTVGGIEVGIVGVTTTDTARTTISTNVADLEFLPPAKSVAERATALRSSGARLVVVVAHAGGKCARTGHDPVTDGCEDASEVFDLVRALPPGTVDVVVAGHTHAVVAHEVNGVAISESHAYGRAFGRVDVTLKGGRVVAKKIFPPRDLCPGAESPPDDTCVPGEYEGARIVRSPAVAQIVRPYLEMAQMLRAEPLGPDLVAPFLRSHDRESALGNLFTDLTREAAGQGTLVVSLFNGGGLRTDLPAGKLLYGALFEAFPFDNRVARVTLDGSTVRRLFANHLQNPKGGILSVSGVTVRAICDGARLGVDVRRLDGRPVKDTDTVEIVASDFMLLGGDAFWGDIVPPPIETDAALVRDEMVRVLRTKKSLDPKRYFDPKKPRFSFPGDRPVDCVLRSAAQPARD